MPLGEVLDISTQVARALHAAHAAGIVHRDIKPENLMLRSDGIVKVLDFGIAKLTDEPPSNSTSFTVRSFINTEPNNVMGTASYMSPEQARGTPVDARSDVFSLGVVIYEMVTGFLPFAGSTSTEILASIQSDQESAPLGYYANALPAEFERIISKALRKNRNERYQTIKGLLTDLTGFARQLELEAWRNNELRPSCRCVQPPGVSST
jgi:serine/threonine protein kinase